MLSERMHRSREEGKSRKPGEDAVASNVRNPLGIPGWERSVTDK